MRVKPYANTILNPDERYEYHWSGQTSVLLPSFLGGIHSNGKSYVHISDVEGWLIENLDPCGKRWDLEIEVSYCHKGHTKAIDENGNEINYYTTNEGYLYNLIILHEGDRLAFKLMFDGVFK